MRKSITIFLALVITFFTIPFGGISALANGKNYDNIKDGDYEITAKALHADKDEASGAASFIEEDATLSIENGEIELTITIPHNDMAKIAGLQIEGNESKNKDGEKWTYTLDTLKTELSSKVQYEVPSLGMEHDVPFRFILEGLDKLPEIEEEEEDIESPEDSEGSDESEEDKDESEGTEDNENGSNNDSNENGSEDESGNDDEDGADNGSDNNDKDEESNGEEEDGTNQSIIELDNGTYTVGASYLRVDNDNASSMARYLGNEVFLTVKDGQTELTVTVNDHNTVTKLQVDGKDADIVKLDGNNRYETFKLKNMDSIVDANVEYQAPYGDSIHYGKAEFRISMDEEAVEKVNDKEQPGYDIEETLINLKDGYYTINTSYINAKDGSVSSMGRYLADNAFLSFEDGKVQLTITVNDDETVTKLQIDGKDAVEKEIDGKKRHETFEFDDLLSLLNANVEYQAPMGNGEVHSGKADFVMSLDVSSVKSAKASDKPEAEEDKVEKPDDLENAKEIDYTILHENGKDDSTANAFFDKPGFLFEKDGKKYVQVTVTNGEMVKGLSSEYGDAVIVKKHDDGSMDVQFRINGDLSDTLLEMDIVVPGLYSETHKAIFSINQDDQITDPKEDPEKEKPEAEKPNEKETKEELLKPDKVYEIDYVINHEDGNKKSIADDFFKKPAFLFEKDGKKYIQMTITNGDMVKDLRSKYGEALLVKENKDGSIIIQLRVNDDLSDLLLDMHITVPAGSMPGFPGYDEEHKAILSFNKDSMKEIDVGDHMLVGASDAKNGNGPTVEGAEGNGGIGNGNNSPEKPTFGQNGNGGNGSESGKLTGATNPKTGDTSTILFYAFLLVGSLIPLALKLRRRYV